MDSFWTSKISHRLLNASQMPTLQVLGTTQTLMKLPMSSQGQASSSSLLTTPSSGLASSKNSQHSTTLKLSTSPSVQQQGIFMFILHLLEDLKALHIDFQLPETKVYAKCFKDNAGCLELAKAPKLHPRIQAHCCQVSSLPWLCQDRCQLRWNFGAHIGFPQTDKKLMDSPKPWDPFCLFCQNPGTHHGMVTQTPGFKRECEIIITSKLCPKLLATFFPTSCTVIISCITVTGGRLFVHPWLVSQWMKT